MAYLQISGLSLAYGDRDLLKDINLNLSEKSRIAIAGSNGCGKSTFLKILSRHIEADRGTIVLQKGATLGYLPQSGLVHRGSTLFDEAESAYEEIRLELERADGIGEKLKTPDLSDEESQELVEELHFIHERAETSGYYHREASIGRILSGLGFSDSDLNKAASAFSGGWQMRIALAKLLLKSPDFLFLDEPTNYLDLEARNWLRDFLSDYHGGVILVSHDRYFLDSTIKEVGELFLGRLKIYKGTYSKYQKQREQELGSLMAAYEQQQEEIAKHEDFIRRFRAKATKAAQVQSRVKMLEKMERIEIPDNLRKMSLSFPEPPHSGKIVQEIEGLSKSYDGEHRVIDNFSFTLEKGEKLVVAGVNGAGKSTLMRILAGRDGEFEGTVNNGAHVSVGYFAQEQDKELDPSLSVLEELEKSAQTADIPRLRTMAGAFLFSGDDIYKKVSFLSGGEKNRLALLKMLLQPFNLLIMDEPTNHLDIHSKDILLEALKSYKGTLIFVSHDRYFIEQLAEKVLELTPEGPVLFQGDYSYYMWKKEQKEGEEETPQPQKDKAAPSSSSAPSETSSQLSREEEKKLKARIRRLRREEESLMEEISQLGEEQQKWEGELSKPEVYSDGKESARISSELEQIKEKEIELSYRWEEVTEELAGLES
ncbi:MAG: ABC-F family ATP-binding cassette domain-containing protein [Spirochaetales bacterium]|nr:ABC-F family ATP-binding cassette domain-containing protein [Spirochaetales bacterium]